MRTVSILSILSVILFSCKKDKEETIQPETVSVKLSFECDGASLVKDQFNYTNDAGNNYSVNRLQFYLSDFSFRKTDGTEVKSDEVFFIDFFENRNLTFNLKSIPKAQYDRIKCCIGLPPSLNITGGLPNTIDNSNMAWPDMMGGGYHFLKMEGQFKFAGNNYGYAIHLGKNPNLVRIESTGNFNLTGSQSLLSMKMNINEWFRTPHTYDLNTDGNYTMGTDSLMLKIAENGTDVFTFQ
jgi:hypothetical protein